MDYNRSDGSRPYNFSAHVNAPLKVNWAALLPREALPLAAKSLLSILSELPGRDRRRGSENFERKYSDILSSSALSRLRCRGRQRHSAKAIN